jgi:hypothetical protein
MASVVSLPRDDITTQSLKWWFYGSGLFGQERIGRLSMKLAAKLASIPIEIDLLGNAQKAMPLCMKYFEGFLDPGQECDSRVEIRVIKRPKNRKSPWGKTERSVFEQLLPTQDVVNWLKESPEYTEDFPLNERAICSYCMGGLLLFDPDSARGRIYLFEQGSSCFQPLYRLLWMYFAQILGEKGGCFVHAAAIVRDGEGHLFMGDSGSGKSTLARHCNWGFVLSDDSPIIVRQNGNCLVFPSPYHQTGQGEGLDRDILQMSGTLMHIYFLIKGSQLALEDVSREEALLMILKRYIHFFPYLSQHAKRALFDLFFEVCYKIPSYNLYFKKNQDILSVINDK